jgi:hypothetical protein
MQLTCGFHKPVQISKVVVDNLNLKNGPMKRAGFTGYQNQCLYLYYPNLMLWKLIIGGLSRFYC